MGKGQRKEVEINNSLLSMFKKIASYFRQLEQKCHRLGGVNNRNLFFVVLESGKFKIELLAGQVPSENLSWFAESYLLIVCSRGGEREKASSFISYKGTNPILEGSTHGLITRLRPHFLIPSHKELGLQHMNFGKTQTFSPQQIIKLEPHKYVICWLNYDKTMQLNVVQQ